MIFGLLYTYTPFSTIVFIPIWEIPGGYVNNVWMAFNLGVLVACILLCWKMLGYRPTPRLGAASAALALTCTFLEPVRTTLFYGQINLVLMLLVLWDFSRDNHGRLRGLGVGLAAGIKLTPVYFIALFAVYRQWRAAATASMVFVASIALTWLVLPVDSRQYWTSTFFQSTRIADDRHPSNQSIRGAIAHLTGQPAPMWLWIAVAGIVAVVGLTIAVRLYRIDEVLLSVTLSGLTASAVSPFSWSHHWVWFVPLLIYLVHRALIQPWWWTAAAGLYVAAGAWPYRWDESNVVIGLFLFPPWWPVTKALLANIYVIAYICVVAGALAMLARSGRQEIEQQHSEPARITTA
ncbi:glycosyltransferase 87 family protein [Rhodococcus sp. NPDC055112]